jgi:hypothetical protein
MCQCIHGMIKYASEYIRLDLMSGLKSTNIRCEEVAGHPSLAESIQETVWIPSAFDNK